MTEPELLERVRRAETRARRRLERGREEDERRLAETGPEPGDLCALAVGSRTLDPAIDWCVVAIDRGLRGNRATLVPVDTFPVAGPRDVVLDAASSPVRRVARGSVSARVGVDALSVDRRFGRVSSAALDLLRRRLAGEASTSATAEEDARDPAYREWFEDHVEPAAAALRRAYERPSRNAPILALPPRRAPGWLALAASVLVAVAATWTVQSWRYASAPDPGGREAALAFFAPTIDTVRAPGTREIEVPAGTDPLVLAFRTLAPEPYPTYELEILRSQALLARFDGLRLQGTSEVVVMLPIERLDEGRSEERGEATTFEARLFGRSADGEIVALERWTFRLSR